MKCSEQPIFSSFTICRRNERSVFLRHSSGTTDKMNIQSSKLDISNRVSSAQQHSRLPGADIYSCVLFLCVFHTVSTRNSSVPVSIHFERVNVETFKVRDIQKQTRWFVQTRRSKRRSASPSTYKQTPITWAWRVEKEAKYADREDLEKAWIINECFNLSSIRRQPTTKFITDKLLWKNEQISIQIINTHTHRRWGTKRAQENHCNCQLQWVCFDIARLPWKTNIIFIGGCRNRIMRSIKLRWLHILAHISRVLGIFPHSHTE